MKLSKDEIQAIHLQSRAWAEMRNRLSDLERIVDFGPTEAGDTKLVRKCVNLVCGEIHMRIANELKDSQT